MPRITQLSAPGKIELKQREPLTAGPGEAIIHIQYAGVCSTDLALFKGDYPVPLPHVCGHEFTGNVKSVGAYVDKNWVGRTVTAEINNTCLAYDKKTLCIACTKGIPSHCQKRTVTGIIQHPGAFADEVRVAAGNLHEIPSNIDPLIATLTEPLAAALQTFAISPIKKNETLVVLGPGKLGILILFAASLKKIKTISVSRSEAKRNRALDFGAQYCFAPQNAVDEIRNITEGLGADLVVDTTGHPDGITQAMDLVQPRGTIACKTTCGIPATGINMTKLVVDEITLQGSRCGPFKPALEIIQAHQEKLKPLITSTRPLEETQIALESAAKENKVVLNIN
ncbi:MAG: alcohol dehydrogenase catalytic domain-containing protein [Nitrospinota bacterium]|nr:alcohol dehydrogenase catalytic domain-containing protein [Nitrospinota bacterium]